MLTLYNNQIMYNYKKKFSIPNAYLSYQKELHISNSIHAFMYQ